MPATATALAQNVESRTDASKLVSLAAILDTIDDAFGQDGCGTVAVGVIATHMADLCRLVYDREVCARALLDRRDAAIAIVSAAAAALTMPDDDTASLAARHDAELACWLLHSLASVAAAEDAELDHAKRARKSKAFTRHKKAHDVSHPTSHACVKKEDGPASPSPALRGLVLASHPDVDDIFRNLHRLSLPAAHVLVAKLDAEFFVDCGEVPPRRTRKEAP